MQEASSYIYSLETPLIEHQNLNYQLNLDRKLIHYFILFLFLHTLLWTLGIYYSRASLPHDTLENITWGLQGEWGYHKHPFLTAWLCARLFTLFHQADWAIYLLAQLLNTCTFVAVWYLARQFLLLRQALIATFLLEGILFYNVNSFNLTSDALQAPLWAFLTLFFYKALTTENIRYWLLTSFFAACALCTKYQSILLISSMFFLFILYPQSRSYLKKRTLFYSLGLFLLLMSPHCYWLYQHQFITVKYALNTSAEYTATKTIWGHLFYPILALFNDILYLTPLLLLMWPFYKKANVNAHSECRKSNALVAFLFDRKIQVSFEVMDPPVKPEDDVDQDHNTEIDLIGSREQVAERQNLKCQQALAKSSLSSFQWHFLLIMGFGPLILTLLLGVIDGNYLPPRWSTAYFFPLGIILIAYIKPSLTSQSMKQFILIFILFSCSLFVFRLVNINFFSSSKNDAFLPNKEIALSLNQLWRERYHKPLVYLAGSNYLVSLITPYLPDQAKPYFNWRIIQNPWINELDLSLNGALFIWDVGANYAWDLDGRNTIKLPLLLLERFPELIILPTKTYRRLSNNHPVLIGVGILPPRSV